MALAFILLLALAFTCFDLASPNDSEENKNKAVSNLKVHTAGASQQEQGLPGRG